MDLKWQVNEHVVPHRLVAKIIEDRSKNNIVSTAKTMSIEKICYWQIKTQMRP